MESWDPRALALAPAPGSTGMNRGGMVGETAVGMSRVRGGGTVGEFRVGSSGSRASQSQLDVRRVTIERLFLDSERFFFR